MANHRISQFLSGCTLTAVHSYSQTLNLESKYLYYLNNDYSLMLVITCRLAGLNCSSCQERDYQSCLLNEAQTYCNCKTICDKLLKRRGLASSKINLSYLSRSLPGLHQVSQHALTMLHCHFLL